MILRRNEFRRGVDGGATSAVVEHHPGEVAAVDITAIEVARSRWAAGAGASPKISHQILALAAPGPFDPEEPNEVALDTQSAGIDHLGHADKRNGRPRRNVVPRLRGTWRGRARSRRRLRLVGVAATGALSSEAASSVVKRPAMNASNTRATAAETAANAYRGRTEGSPGLRRARESGTCGRRLRVHAAAPDATGATRAARLLIPPPDHGRITRRPSRCNSALSDLPGSLEERMSKSRGASDQALRGGLRFRVLPRGRLG